MARDKGGFSPRSRETFEAIKGRQWGISAHTLRRQPPAAERRKQPAARAGSYEGLYLEFPLRPLGKTPRALNLRRQSYRDGCSPHPAGGPLTRHYRVSGERTSSCKIAAPRGSGRPRTTVSSKSDPNWNLPQSKFTLPVSLTPPTTTYLRSGTKRRSSC